MINGHVLENEQVEKVINSFRKYGRTVYAEGVRYEASRFDGSFNSAAECVEMFKAVIWNKGLIW